MVTAKERAFAEVRNRKLLAEKTRDDLIDTLRKDEKFASLENERDTLRFEISRLGYLNKDIGTLNVRYNFVKAEFAARIKELGHEESELTPNYTCKKCNDEGMVDGKICECVENLIYSLLGEEFPDRLTEIDDPLKISTAIIAENEKAAHKKCYKWLAKYVNEFPAPTIPTVLMIGAVGTGKTFAATVTANALLKKGYSVYTLSAVSLNKLFLRYHLAPLENKPDIWAPLVECDLLFIDDLGTENVLNNVTIPYLLELICERNRKPLLITTNLLPGDLEDRYGQRVFSRLSIKENTVFMFFNGADMRSIIKK